MTPAGERIAGLLTEREKDVCVALCEGKNGQEIAARFGWKTPQVVKNYLRGIYNKVGVEDRLSLAITLFHHGVVECPCGSVDRLDTALDLIRTGVIACPCAERRKTA